MFQVSLLRQTTKKVLNYTQIPGMAPTLLGCVAALSGMVNIFKQKFK